MIYQKSMLKIYETLISYPLKEFIIEEIIKKAGVGRTSGFKAINWLGRNKLIEITPVGKQKIIKLVLNETSLNFKFFLDSLGIKNLSIDILFQVNLFVYLTYKRAVYKHINAIFIFGSAIDSKKPNDIDLLIVGGNLYDHQEDLKQIRKLVENICGLPINFHFNIETDIYNLFQKLIVYNQSYSTNLLKDNDKSLSLKLKYAESLYNINSIINNINDNELLAQLFYRLIINLAYCNCWLENKININKVEAIGLFRNKYINKIKNFDKLKNIDKFEIFKKITNEIGQKIFA